MYMSTLCVCICDCVHNMHYIYMYIKKTYFTHITNTPSFATLWLASSLSLILLLSLSFSLFKCV